jgi:tetratricopeptide (TPR) repeat protein
MKIAVYAISRNEAQFVERWVASAQDADIILLADTGSTDDTVTRAQRGGATTKSLTILPWRFDTARNAALALLPEDVDICIALDLDEVLKPGWRAALEKAVAANPSANQFRYNFIASWSGDGKPGITFYDDRIHARHGFSWTWPVHEQLVADERRAVNIDETLVEHHPDKTRSSFDALALLQDAVADYPDSARMAHYHGQYLMEQGRHDEAIAEFDRALKLPSTHAAERGTTLRFKGRCHWAKLEFHAAEAAFTEATNVAPFLRETWVDLAQGNRTFMLWEMCQYACERALSITDRTIYINEPSAWSDWPETMLREAIAKQVELKQAKAASAPPVKAAPKEAPPAVTLPPKKLKIAVYGICKNEAKFVERCLKSATDADYILFADTGSTDNSVELLRRHGDRVETISISPWRFDDARNAVLALLPADIDFCVSLDLDEILVPNWRALFEKAYAENPDANQFLCNSIYTWLPDGKPGVTYFTGRIHARHGFRWKYPVHELLRTDNFKRATIKEVVIEHHADWSRRRSQYLPMLKAAVAEAPEDERMVYLYGRELMDQKHDEEAIKQFDRYLGMKTAHWPPEIATLLRYKARCHTRLGQHEAALAALIRATETMPDTREPWVDLAEVYKHLERWAECQAACEKALAITEHSIHISDPKAWSDLPLKLRDEAVTKQAARADGKVMA